ncbi:hypothetical protein A3B21_03220 [Candidatus Uhrbacteria bacterium RIFCSPLOWO2_01_FULL_47_24]|uniref:PEP-utilising enzyme mobile domain-containing protein n=1 Tax=Candidatus Uhrbacteria bacterium RIFCSPLOWO2_01_FULL_47_24 TaxID=1802401 RepID=A0A1F7URN6_9BACT|nr:MAG: hypothetical protein A3D58_03820 [Candidatus Uhrbacteria bacterium RIFCSPHIGHO2_02_FULL_46_47]OGL80951.1 MAG: hypothetical protein A3B21_03220 [Candidatus Uhrbacteria bacterium RIFCSPLOWO2_01_FULL_47_24]OGL84286.1 MAG: hypothetical protein A3J03_03220 [Candidatus Uhrbacteria bacterium RIFCSPLOWO2_02_FULL_46_25]OGL93296.1 MAG: hypothetical protein A3H11_02985 [Candidatus Uhrbacteria bacterium RIFCSPLOWO2_12_FULL_47_10]
MKSLLQNQLKGKAWYHQRFDGSPLYLFAVGEGKVKRDRRRPSGTEAGVRVCFFKDGKADWYLDMEDVQRGSEVMIGLAKRDPHTGAKLLRAWRSDEQAFQRFFEQFSTIKLRAFSDEALFKFYNRYINLFINRISSSPIIDHFALGTDQYIANMIRQEIGKIEQETEFTKVFSIATAPTHQSFINEAEMELLKIAIEHNPSQIPSPGLRPPSPSGRGEGEGKKGGRGSYGKEFEQALKNYQQKYFWIKNNYFDAHVLSQAHFKKEVELWRKSGADLEVKYKQLRDTPRLSAQKKAALFKKYKFSRLLRTLLKISEDFTWWQDERKRSTFLNIHMGVRILGEMARRRGIDPELTKFFVPNEVERWFVHGKPSMSELKERQKGCGVVSIRSGYSIVTGKAIEAMRRTMFPQKQQDAVRDIRGLAASVGRVVGTVKIVDSARQVGKVQKGDILVAVMTRPDYIAGLKKAAAVVTNEGGITCHAAIVSRELGIPCVIGTKIATEVLKDGDLVEVNANHGVVTVLKRAV